MDKEQLKKLAKDPRLISGIYNYCDRWCERCAFTSKCMTYALSNDEIDNPQTQDITNKAFWGKLHEIFQVTFEMLKESADEMGIDLNAIDDKEIQIQEKKVHEIVENQPYTKAAFSYAKMVDDWFKSNNNLIETKADELVSLAQAQIPGIRPDKDTLKIQDCLEVARWYQHQIYVKLCRASSGMLRGELEHIEYAPEDANGSAKVAIIGIERSIAAWGEMLNYFPQQEGPVLDILVKLKRLLKQLETAFPDARVFIRPGFDTTVSKRKMTRPRHRKTR
jgi:predicted hydrocarbon binding protein